MHAPTLKRPTLNRYIGLALALGLAASVALNVAMFARSNDDTAQVSHAPAASIQSANAMRRFADAKEKQIDAAQAAISPRTTLGAQPMTLAEHNELMLHETYTAQGQARPSSALTPSRQRYLDLKSDQLDGIQSQAEQRFAQTAMDRFILDPAH